MPEAAVVPHLMWRCVKMDQVPDKELTATIKEKNKKNSQCKSV